MSLGLYEYQCIAWDMDISLSELLKRNPVCKVDRNYKKHKTDDCYNGYCMYLKHNEDEDYNTMIGISEDGFVYLGDGEFEGIQVVEDTNKVLKEMFFYGEWIKQKNNNLKISKIEKVRILRNEDTEWFEDLNILFGHGKVIGNIYKCKMVENELKVIINNQYYVFSAKDLEPVT